MKRHRILKKRTSKHHKFSPYLNKVYFKNDILIIRGQRKLASFFIFVFLLACLYCLFTLSLPLIIKGSLSLGILILIYAFLDVFFSENQLKWNIRSDFVKIKRSSLKLKITYQGSSVDKFKLSLKEELDSESNIPSYNVLLRFKNEKFSSTYLLETFSMSEATALKSANDWSLKLKIPISLPKNFTNQSRS